MKIKTGKIIVSAAAVLLSSSAYALNIKVPVITGTDCEVKRGQEVCTVTFEDGSTEQYTRRNGIIKPVPGSKKEGNGRKKGHDTRTL